MNYFQPDDIWKQFGVMSEIDFLEKIVLKGQFHPLVPRVIVEDYKIVEKLLFYSYFYYPLLDEAFSKSTRIFEASVTLKLENIEKPNIKKVGYESLSSKLKRLEKNSSKDLFVQWQQAKELRNSFAHPKAGSLMGINLLNAFKHNLNLINTLFLESGTIKEKERQHSKLIQKANHFAKKLCTLEYNCKKILIYGLKPCTVGLMKKSGQSLWLFIPISGEKQIEKVNDLPQSFAVVLRNVQINKNGLSGINSTTNQSITLTLTNSLQNIEKLNRHNHRIRELEILSPDISAQYMALLQLSLNKEIINFLYEEW